MKYIKEFKSFKITSYNILKENVSEVTKLCNDFVDGFNSLKSIIDKYGSALSGKEPKPLNINGIYRAKNTQFFDSLKKAFDELKSIYKEMDDLDSSSSWLTKIIRTSDIKNVISKYPEKEQVARDLIIKAEEKEKQFMVCLDKVGYTFSFEKNRFEN